MSYSVTESYMWLTVETVLPNSFETKDKAKTNQATARPRIPTVQTGESLVRPAAPPWSAISRIFGTLFVRKKTHSLGVIQGLLIQLQEVGHGSESTLANSVLNSSKMANRMAKSVDSSAFKICPCFLPCTASMCSTCFILVHCNSRSGKAKRSHIIVANLWIHFPVAQFELCCCTTGWHKTDRPKQIGKSSDCQATQFRLPVKILVFLVNARWTPLPKNACSGAETYQLFTCALWGFPISCYTGNMVQNAAHGPQKLVATLTAPANSTSKACLWETGKQNH